MASNGMITRHFEHSSGATAMLEMPAGWSRSCYYILTTHSATNIKADVDRRTFNTPEEARQAAVARERLALANGWKPRMAANTVSRASRSAIYRTTGERIAGVDLAEVTVHNEWDGSHASFHGKPTLLHRTATLDCRTDEPIGIEAGYRILVQIDDQKSQMVLAALVNRIGSSEMLGEKVRYLIDCDIVQLETGEQEAIELWHDREAILQAGIETDTSVTELWDWLGTRVSDASERAQVNAAILRGRAERQARLAREAEAATSQARFDREREEARRFRELEDAARRPLLPKQPNENLRVPGVDLSKPKKRKINLGE